MKYKLLSLFDGSGGFPLAGSMCGVEPVAASEVEPYPIAVTRSRFPNMKHLGDISKINGAEIEPVDIITFGSPCQDLSVAGKRAGLKHEDNGDDETTRSGLFMEAVRIIREMRGATNGRYPTFALWENVPGAFSSNKGDDFRVVLEELIKIVEPTAKMPPCDKNGWPYADCYMGAGWSIAYRTFDAQHWGVPQRRRRIHLVLDLRGERAHKVLFEREGLRGHLAEGRTPWQATAGDAENCAGAADREGVVAVATRQGGAEISTNGICPTITAAAGMSGNNQPYVCCKDREGDGINILTPWDSQGNQVADGTGSHIYPTLRGCGGAGYQQGYVLAEADLEAVGGNVPRVMEPKAAYWDGSQVCGTLTANNANGAQRMPDKENFNCVIAIDRAFFNQGQNAQYDPQLYTDGTNPTLVARGPNAVAVRYIVRRLTPTECARLQGFPDRWGDIEPKEDFTDEEYRFWLDVRNTHATVIGGKEAKDYTKQQMLTWYGKLHTDSAEYKLWGNGIALPPALYCMEGIVEALEKEQEETSDKKRDECGRFTFKGEPVLVKGYPAVYDPSHPRAKANGYVKEHILVVEKCLGRRLREGEVVHHINEDKTDNAPENLMVFQSHSDHMKYHWMLRNPEKSNGIALPPALYCMQGMVDALKAEEPKRTRIVSVRRKR